MKKYLFKIEKICNDIEVIKNKISQSQVSNFEIFQNVLKAQQLLLEQQKENLVVLKNLESKIQLLPHQIYGSIRVKNDFNGRGILADEVGLGKTVEAGIVLKEYIVRGLVKSVLILVPSTLVTQWKGEMFHKFDEDFVIATRVGLRYKGFYKYDRLICSLDTAKEPRNAGLLTGRTWDMIIVDEAHRLKNEKTLNYRFIKSLTKKYFLLLTATPVQNSVKELFNLVNLIRPGIFGTWQSFRSRYILDERARTINLQKRSELQKILSGVIVRTRRDEVRAYLKFPNRVPRTHRLRATPQERELYQRLTQMIREEDRHLRSIGAPRTSRFQLINLQRQLTSSTSAVISALNNKIISIPTNESIYRRIISLAEKIKEDTKMKMIRNIVSQDEKSNTKYLIFTSFLDTQKYIQDSLTRNGFSVVLYNGQMSTSEKDVSVLRFKQDTQIMISTEAGSEGKNFQFCSNLINYDLPWNPMQVEQRVGRLHRIGQKNDVIIHSLSIKNTIEDYILILLYEKIRLFQMTIGDLDLFLDDDIALLPEEIFDIYMNSTDEDDAENRFSVLSEKLLDKKKVAESVQQFDSSVFQNFDLSSLPMVRK